MSNPEQGFSLERIRQVISMCEDCNEKKELKRQELKVDMEELKNVKGFHKIAKPLGEKKYEDITGMKFNRLTAITELCSVKNGKITGCGCWRKEKGKNLRDLTGQKFGELTVISRAEEDYIGLDGRHRPRWNCLCSCGGTIILKTRQLVNGSVTRCDECNPRKRRTAVTYDLVGRTFGKWTVLEKSPNRPKNGHTRWICRCSCGTIREVDGGHLLGGRSTSCGCSHVDNTTAANLTGQKFHRWTAIEKVGKDKKNNILWRCVCECGSEGVISAHRLLSGSSKSCGCFKSDRTREVHFKSLVGRRFEKLVVLERIEDHIYPDGSHRVKYRCRCDCGGITEVTSIGLLSGDVRSCGCTQSFGECRVAQILEENGIIYKKQKSYKDLLSDKGCRLRFDFYIPSQGYLIEYDGMYHYQKTGRIWCTEEHLKRTQYHDNLKNDYCKKNNIPLIRIPYVQYNNLCIEDLKLETTKFRVV